MKVCARRIGLVLAALVLTDALLCLLLWHKVEGWWSSTLNTYTVADAQVLAPDIEGIGVVFYAGTHTLRGQRVAAALTLRHAGLIRDLALAGGARPERGFWGSVQVAKGLESMGWPREQLWVDRTSRDSSGNLQWVDSMLDAKSSDKRPRLFLLSDRLHLFRLHHLQQAKYRNWTSRDIIWLDTGAEGSTPLDFVGRLHWEIAAWLSHRLTPALRNFLIDVSR